MTFIAEIGLNHNGNHNLCYELIRQAKLSGADIAKFQLGWRAGEGEMNALDEEMLQKLVKWCAYFEIELMFSIITPDALEMIRKFDLKRYKVASRTVIDRPELIEEMLKDGKETIISVGMWDEPELPFEKTEQIRYLWCKSKYPTEPWDLTDLPKDFTTSPYDGYSDHSIGIETALMAITRGAQMIEKHFTLDKSDTTIRDHALSATPEEFALLVQLGRDIHKRLALGV